MLRKEKNILERMSEYFIFYGSGSAYMYICIAGILLVLCFCVRRIGTHVHIDYIEERIIIIMIIITMFILFSASVIFFCLGLYKLIV